MTITLEHVAAVVFAASVAAATAALVLAALERTRRRVSLALVGLLGAAAATTWVLFALDPSGRLAVRAVGTTAAVLIAVSASALHRALERVRRIDLELDRQRAVLDDLVEHEVQTRAAELEHILARARADSISQLVEEERRIAEERRRDVAEREREASAKLSETVTEARARLESRLVTWADDLERSQQALAEELARLAERQRARMGEIEAAIARDGDSLQAAADEQKAVVVRLRQELEQSAQAVVEAAANDLEQHAAERRRALHDVAERLRKRERDLTEQIEREEANIVERVHASLGEVERRQIEGLERVVSRASVRFSEAAAEQFDGQIRSAREDAARRLGRELDLAVQRFSREAEQVLAEKMSQAGDVGVQQVERRLGQLRAGLERQRDEFLVDLERRVGEIETHVRDRIRELATEAEGERLVIEARLHEVARRVEELLARAEARID